MYSTADKNNTLTGTPKTANARTGHVLACLTCQKRKVKCDRNFPCANCVRHQAECEPALTPRRRRRRFPERDLLNRIRRYEDILRHHQIPFEALHPDHAAGSSSSLTAAQNASPAYDGTASLTNRQDRTWSETPQDITGSSSPSKAVYVYPTLCQGLQHSHPLFARLT